MHFIQYRNTYLSIGAGIFIGTIALIAIFGFRLGIDFTGGSLVEVSYTERPLQAVLDTELASLGLGNHSLRESTDDRGRDGYILRTRSVSEAERQQVESVLTSAGEGGEVTRFTSIGPVIGEELKDKALWAVGAVVLIIVLYVAFAFRGVRKPVGSWVYGSITILALLHDVLVPTALMSVLGYTMGIEIDVLFVMALLAVLGYSVNDTIVVFDRVRENLILYRQEKKVVTKDEFNQPVEHIEYVFTKPFATIAGEAIDQTLLRSINTSLTTFVAVAALYWLGGEATQSFALVLMAGIVAGTYSSIFFAAPLLVAIEEWQRRRAAK